MIPDAEPTRKQTTRRTTIHTTNRPENKQTRTHHNRTKTIPQRINTRTRTLTKRGQSMKTQYQRLMIMNNDTVNDVEKRFVNLDRQVNHHDPDLTKRWESAIQELRICLSLYENLLAKE